MNKRFTKKDYAVLQLLSRHKTLDALLEYEPIESHYYDIEQYKTATALLKEHNEGRYKLTPLEQLNMAQLAEKSQSYRKDFIRFRQAKTHLQVRLKREKEYDQLLVKYPDFSVNIDQLCQTQLPTAYYIPLATYELMQQSSDAIMAKISSLVVDLPPESGLLLFERFTGSDQLNMFAYQLSATSISGFLITQSIEDGIMNVPKFFHVDYDNYKLNGAGVDENFGEVCLASLLFIHFFETERVVAVQPVANARSTARVELNGNKYDTELTYPINVVDAFWYTTILRDDPFLVKGHFRKQPYGPGRSQYKVRWITGFMKKGYHRKAKQPNTAATDLTTD